MTILFLSCPREIHLCPRRRNDVHSIKSLKSERIHTMKTMRKLFTVLLAVAMTLALAVTAFAETGSITITNPQEGKDYTAYKIFDVTYSGENYSYTISKDSAAYATVKAYADTTGSGLTLTDVANTNKCNVATTGAFSPAAFAKYLKENSANLGTGTAFVKDDETMKASNLELGYYFVSGTSGSVCELVTAKNVQIRDKNEAPQIEKTVDDADKTVEVGQVLTYTITGKVPDTKGYTTYTYKVTDNMTKGLTYNDDVNVTIDGATVTGVATKKDNGFVVQIDMVDYKEHINADVVITYTATVNEGAIERNVETNTAKLTYSNDPATGSTTDTDDVTVNVYSFNIAINKFAGEDKDAKLAGAKFVLKKTVDGETRYYKYNDTDKKVEWVADKALATEVTTDAGGAAHFNGLEAGTYYLEETVAPAGYNQLTKDIEIVITDNGHASIKVNDKDASITPAEANLSLTADVSNSTGTVLPETGGTGTIIFVALGALAVICAGVFLVTNKRMSKESF